MCINNANVLRSLYVIYQQLDQWHQSDSNLRRRLLEVETEAYVERINGVSGRCRIRCSYVATNSERLVGVRAIEQLERSSSG